MEENRNIMADPSSNRQNQSNIKISVFNKRICTNNTAVNKRDISKPCYTKIYKTIDLTLCGRENSMSSSINNTAVNKRDISERSISQKNNYISNTGVNRRDVAEPSITQKKNCTGNTRVNRRDVLKPFIIQKNNYTTSTGLNKIDISVPSITKDTLSRVRIFPFKEQKCINNIVSNYSTAHLSFKKNSIQEEEPIIESTPLDKCLRVWSGVPKDKSNINESNSKVPNVTKYNNNQCRACLKKGSTPIYAEDSNEDLAEAIKTIGGIEISTNDCYPKYLCKFCLKLLLSGVLFRKTAQMSDKIFRKSLIGTKQVPVKINNILSENENISDTDIRSDNEELSVLNKQSHRHTELPDHNVIELYKEPINKPEVKKLNDNKPRDKHNRNNNLDNALQENVDHNTTKLINIVMPKSRHHNGNKLHEFLHQNITNILQKPSNIESANIINNSPHENHEMTTRDISRDVLNQTISKVLQNVSKTKLEKANIINIIVQSNGITNTIQECNEQNKNYEHSDDNDDTLQECNEQNMTYDYHADNGNTLQECNEQNKNDEHSDDNDNTIQECNEQNMTDDCHADNGNTLQECNEQNMTDDYFGDNDKDHSYREPTILDKRKRLHKNIWVCEECGLKYNSCKEYVTHNTFEHPERKKLQCIICQKSYSPNYLAKHVYFHEIGPLMCDVCGKEYLDLNNFNNHCKTHTTEFSFKCSQCAYRANSKTYLKLHMITHAKEKPYKCPHCPQQFPNTCNLKRHVLKHKGERPFKCTCKQAFYSKGDLTRHVKSKHLGIKKGHICRICGKTFSSQKKTTDHERDVHNKPKFPAHGIALHVRHEMKQLENNSLKT